MSNKSTETLLWNRVGKAMQDWYRHQIVPCVGGGKNCTGFATVRHHFIPWGRSIALRFEAVNLVPTCATCHKALHDGDVAIKENCQSSMRWVWGTDWDYQLIEIDQDHVKRSRKDTRDYLLDQLNNYTLW